MDISALDDDDPSSGPLNTHEPVVMLSEDYPAGSANQELAMPVSNKCTEPSEPISSVRDTTPATGTSSRPRRGAAAAAASTISHLAQSEALGLPSPPPPLPPPPLPPPPAAAGESIADHTPAESSACEVCLAPVGEAAAGDTAALRAAAALLGAGSTPAWLCQPCAELLRLIDGHRRQLEAAQRQFWRRRREGAARKQAIIEANAVKAEPVEAKVVCDSDEKEDTNTSDHQEDAAETVQSDKEGGAVPPMESTGGELAAATSRPARRPAGRAGRRSRTAIKQCDTCGKQFSTWRALDGHMNVHTGERPYACAHCDRRFPSQPALRQHEGIHFNKWVCEICQKVYSTEPALSTHRSYVHFPERLKTITCPVCGKDFLGQKRYNKHSLTHTGESERFPCPEEGCDSSFKTRNALNVHAHKHQGKRFACDQCPALFFTKASMQQHMVRHGSVEARFPCPICSRRFIYNSILKCHLATAHNAERDRVCEVCGATFTCNSALNAHKLAHQEERPHVCDVCGTAFKRKQVLVRHVRFVHNREVTARCEHCDKGFQTQHKLKVHLRSHTGERPYACPFCQKRFTQRSHVRSHMLMHVEYTSASAEAGIVPVVSVPVQVVAAAVEVASETEAPPALEVSEVTALLPVVPTEPETEPELELAAPGLGQVTPVTAKP